MSWKKNLAITTALVGTTAAAIHIINKFIFFSATVDNLLDNTTGNFYEWKFGKLFYVKKGEGKPILLIHDLTTYSSAYEWNKIIDKLSETNTVYALDLLGCGRSDKPNLTYTNFLYVQLVTDFINHVIEEKTDIIVTGESGSFVLGACHNDDTMVDKIIMVNPSDISLMSKIPGKRSKILTKLINCPIIGTLLYNILTTKNDLESLFCMDYFYDQGKINDKTVSTYYESAHTSVSSSKHLFASLAGYYLTSNVPLYLDSLTNSIFIIAGKGNPDSLTFAEAYQNILPSIEIVEMDKSKLLPQLENPEEFVEHANILLNDIQE